MSLFSGNQEDPMHYGEVFGVWSAVMGGKGAIAGYQTLVNHVGDGDLAKLLTETIKQGQAEVEEMEALLKANGIGLPPTPPERAEVEFEDIPVGARFMDQEIAAMVAKDVGMGLVMCSQMMSEAIREDIGMMFGQFHVKKAALGAKYLRLSKEKGWLIPPPMHQK